MTLEDILPSLCFAGPAARLRSASKSPFLPVFRQAHWIVPISDGIRWEHMACQLPVVVADRAGWRFRDQSAGGQAINGKGTQEGVFDRGLPAKRRRPATTSPSIPPALPILSLLFRLLARLAAEDGRRARGEFVRSLDRPRRLSVAAAAVGQQFPGLFAVGRRQRKGNSVAVVGVEQQQDRVAVDLFAVLVDVDPFSV